MRTYKCTSKRTLHEASISTASREEGRNPKRCYSGVHTKLSVCEIQPIHLFRYAMNSLIFLFLLINYNTKLPKMLKLREIIFSWTNTLERARIQIVFFKKLRVPY